MKEKSFEIKALEGEESTGTFEGWLAVYGNEDRDGDIIEKGAFAESVRRKAVIPMCFNHNRSQVIGKLELTDEINGVHVKGTLNLADPTAANIETLIKMGALDSLSIGMMIREYVPIDAARPFGGWLIKRAEALEGSIVTVPSNELAKLTDSKSLSDEEREELKTLRTEKRLARVTEILTEAQRALVK